MYSTDPTAGGGSLRVVQHTKKDAEATDKAVLVDITGEGDDEQHLQDGVFNSILHEVISISDSDPGSSRDIRQRPSMVTQEELAAILEKHSLTGDPRETLMEASSKLVKVYLIKNEPEFVRVMEFRDRGWNQNKEKGDAHFKTQRTNADQADHSGEERFYIMMQQIAEEMNLMTRALDPHQQGPELKCLDICMAPGGYTAAVLKRHPNAKCFGITLPTKQGGHPLHIPTNVLAGLKEVDVTMLANEFMNNLMIPKTHPAHAEFIYIRPFRYYKFDLVFCDGMVLRTQPRGSYRERVEVTRLACSQMMLALQRVAVGGTIVMLLHKIDSFPTALILYTFSKFAEVTAFKPARKHGSRSSFYMVAKNVQPYHTAALSAIDDWKDSWWMATFGGEEGTGKVKEDPPESLVRRMLEEFGDRLIEMGRPIWRIQADNLSRTEYAGDGSAPTFQNQNRRVSSSSSQERTPKNPINGKNLDWSKVRKENIPPFSPTMRRQSDMGRFYMNNI